MVFQRGGVSVRSQPWLHQNERARLREMVQPLFPDLFLARHINPEQIFTIEAIIAMDTRQQKANGKAKAMASGKCNAVRIINRSRGAVIRMSEQWHKLYWNPPQSLSNQSRCLPFVLDCLSVSAARKDSHSFSCIAPRLTITEGVRFMSN